VETPSAPPSAQPSQGIRADLFGDPVRAEKPAAKPAPKPAPVIVAPVITSPVSAPNPYLDWRFSGLVTSGEDQMALLENTRTGSGRFVRVNDSFEGGTIKSVSPEMLEIADSSGIRRVERFGEWSLLQKPSRPAAPGPAEISPLPMNMMNVGGRELRMSGVSIMQSTQPVVVTKKDRDRHFEGKVNGNLLRKELEQKNRGQVQILNFQRDMPFSIDRRGAAGGVQLRIGR
jgi:hypothetical protein